MHRSSTMVILSVLLSALVVQHGSAARILVDRELYGAEQDSIPCIIGYRNEQGRQRMIGNFATLEGSGLRKISALRAFLRWSDVEEMELDEDIAFIEADVMVHQLGEIHPYGLAEIGAKDLSFLGTPRLSSAQSSPGNCSDPNSFKIAIVDSGLYRDHPDLPCKEHNCIGAEFGLEEGIYWHSPTSVHGTAVAGIMGAVRDGTGIAGTLLNSLDVCWIVPRVFPDEVQGNYLSAVLNGVEWAVEQGAKVINLSLGSETPSESAELLFERIQQEGIITVAAAGNAGTSELSYPAGYSSVISVAAVDMDREHCDFSQHNSQVDISAPGAKILSTVPPTKPKYTMLALEYNDHVEDIKLLPNSPGLPNGEAIQGEIIDCAEGVEVCPSGSSPGHICLIARTGAATSETKALNCQAGGGSAAIIYNTFDANLVGSDLPPGSAVTIPTVGVWLTTGIHLYNSTGQVASIQEMVGYAYGVGTSYASPYVAAAASVLWQACPACSSAQLRDCMTSSAMDLGEPGWDEYYGAGLVQVEPAYACLAQSCCSDTGYAPESTPPPVATPAPTTAAPRATPAPVDALPRTTPAPSTPATTISPTVTPTTPKPTPGPTTNKPMSPPTAASTPSPTAPPTTVDLVKSCAEAKTDFAACLSAVPVMQAGNCLTCSRVLEPVATPWSTCDGVAAHVCSQLGDCDCGVCTEAATALAACSLVEGQADCDVDCSVPETSEMDLALPTLSPTVPAKTLRGTMAPTWIVHTAQDALSSSSDVKGLGIVFLGVTAVLEVAMTLLS